MTSEFDRDTAARASGDGGFDVDLRPGWVVGGGVNGGYLLATLGRAIRQAAPATPDPLTISAYYLSASRPGPAVVATRVLRRGGTTATVAAELDQEGTTRITALATYGDLAGLPDEVATTAVEPDLPPREECVSSRSAPPGSDVPPLLDRFDLLLDPPPPGGRPVDRAAAA